MGTIIFIFVFGFALFCGLELKVYLNKQDPLSLEIDASDVLIDGYLELVDNADELDLDEIKALRDILVTRMRKNQEQRLNESISNDLPANVLSIAYFQKKIQRPGHKQMKSS